MAKHRKKTSPTFKAEVSGIYYLLQNGRLVYVGQSRNVWCRVADHYRDGHILFDEWFYEEIPSEPERLAREATLIDTYKPESNGYRGRRAKVRHWRASTEAWHL